jgi:hypothetical protein
MPMHDKYLDRTGGGAVPDSGQSPPGGLALPFPELPVRGRKSLTTWMGASYGPATSSWCTILGSGVVLAGAIAVAVWLVG